MEAHAADFDTVLGGGQAARPGAGDDLCGIANLQVHRRKAGAATVGGRDEAQACIVEPDPGDARLDLDRSARDGAPEPRGARRIVGLELDRGEVDDQVLAHAGLPARSARRRPGSGKVARRIPLDVQEGGPEVAGVKLDEGPTLMTNIVDCPQTPEALQLYMPVQVSFAKQTDDITLPLFAPVKG